MKKYFILFGIIACVIGFAVASFLYVSWDRILAEKVYIAAEGDGAIVVFDPARRRVLSTIDLSREHEGKRLLFMPHNVQVSPDNGTVWVTANAGTHMDHTSRFLMNVYAHGKETKSESTEADEVLIIDPLRDRIVRRIPIKSGVHLAHVVLTPDSAYAYVTAQKEGAIYKINAKTFAVEKLILARNGSEPHGIRIAPDGSSAYIAMLKGQSLGMLDLRTDALSEVALGGAAVQAGITPDGKYVVASLYDTKQLAIYRQDTNALTYVALPQTSRGPIQMYPTPDSKFMYLADQGYYFGEPESEWVYKIDIVGGAVVKEIKAGRAPHGIVVSRDGKFAYVTNLLSSDISIIDTAKDIEVGRIPVGKEPNGISIWYSKEVFENESFERME